MNLKMGILVFLHLLLTIPPQIMAAGGALRAVVRANTRFSYNMHTRLFLAERESEKNIFFSPLSLHAVLSMAYQGAKGETIGAFRKALAVSDRTAAAGYHDLIDILNDVPNVTLHLANKIYVKKGFKLKNDFLTTTKKNFLSEAVAMAFTPADAAAATINRWVEQKTNNKIKDLISPDDLDADTRLILINAIYFKGNWKHKFHKKATKTQKFYLNEYDTIDVQMMRQTAKFGFKVDDDLDAKVLQMPYANEDLSLVIVLPNKRDGIEGLEMTLLTGTWRYNLSKIIDGMQNVEVEVELPKFKIESTMDLGDVLEKLGLGKAFGDNADFSGMLKGESVKISKVIQKAFIEVNEKGAEATAASGMGVFQTSSIVYKHPTTFNVDHPFMIYLISNHKQFKRPLPLFIGKILNPGKN